MLPPTRMTPAWTKYLLFASIVTFLVFFHFSRSGDSDIAEPSDAAGSSSADSSKPNDNGYLPYSEAKELCATRKWKPWKHTRWRRKIYDLVLVSTELDWLSIRLGELSKEVDYFIIAESPYTFTNFPKPLHVDQNISLFDAYKDKIIHHVINHDKDPSMKTQQTFDREKFDRNAMYDQVLPYLTGEQAPRRGDVILVSDVDEVPRPSTLRQLRNCDYPDKLTLLSDFYYYSFQWKHRGRQWPHPQATYYKSPSNTITPENLRRGLVGRSTKIDNAAWHCSSCFSTIRDMVTKIQGFSHTKFNKPEYTNRSEILRRVRYGIDLFDRDEEVYERVDGNEDVPRYLLEHKKEFAYMMDRDPESGNFLDWRKEDAKP